MEKCYISQEQIYHASFLIKTYFKSRGYPDIILDKYISAVDLMGENELSKTKKIAHGRKDCLFIHNILRENRNGEIAPYSEPNAF